MVMVLAHFFVVGEKTEGYTLLYKKHTLRVYKKVIKTCEACYVCQRVCVQEFGDNRMMARGEFIIPVSPYQVLC